MLHNHYVVINPSIFQNICWDSTPFPISIFHMYIFSRFKKMKDTIYAKVSICERLTQRRTPDSAPDEDLKRCLGIFDLVNSGFSIVVGAGIFVITPVLAAHTTGPAVTLSYLVAGLAALVSALTYAELAGRFTGIGSAYLYVYYVLGELAAGVIGVSIIIEQMIGLASLVKSLSIYSDQLLFNGTIIAYEIEKFAINVPFMTKYVDLFGLLILIACGALNLWGVKQTVIVSAVCNVVVVFSLLLIIVVGFAKGSFSNWNNKSTASENFGVGGYFPYGVSGVFMGASLAYYSYAGFDAIACLGCEAKNPQRDIPVAIVLTFGLVMTLYILVCGAITYVAPYYTLVHEAGMSLAFHAMPWVALVVALGAVLATATGSFASILTTSRIVFSMAQDGIVFRQLKYVGFNQVPVVAIIVSMILPAVGILLLDIKELVMMNSGGSLVCFCLTNICVIVGRYQPHVSDTSGQFSKPEKQSIAATFIFWAICLISSGCFNLLGLTVAGLSSGIIFFLAALILLIVINLKFTEVKKPSAFQCPLVPWLPGAGVYINSALMVSLPLMTWARVSACTLLGLVCYLLYGLRYSSITQAKQNTLTWVPGEEDEDVMYDKNSDSFNDMDKLMGNEVT